MPKASTAPETSERILDIAEALVQTRGFNGFSYADIAAELGITKASLHYHFPTKAKLGESLVERYERNFLARLGQIERGEGGARAKLDAYVAVHLGVLEAGRMCLCGMLAADFATLPEPVGARVRGFFAADEAWLTRLLAQGRARGELAFPGEPADHARFLIGALEGLMLTARLAGDPTRFQTTAAILLAAFAPATETRRTRAAR